MDSLINTMKAVPGLDESAIELILYIGQKTGVTAEEFSLQVKDLSCKITPKRILSIFGKIRKKFPPTLTNDAARDFPRVGQIYIGRVIWVSKSCCRVMLERFKGKVLGSLSTMEIGDGTCADLRRTIKPTMKVFVKVLSISYDHYFLSMKAVNQITGQDLNTPNGIEREPVNLEINTRLPNFLGLRIERFGCGISRTSQEQLVESDTRLYCLGAIDEDLKMTDLGNIMSKFPVGPSLSRMLLAGIDFQCSHEILMVAAMIAACPSPQIEERRDEADWIMPRFFQPGGDHLTILAVFEAFEENGGSRDWCSAHCMNFSSLNAAQSLRNDILTAMNRMGLEILRAEKDNQMIRKAISAGMFSKSARWDPLEGCYVTLVNNNRRVQIHPRSALYHEEEWPRFVVYDSIVKGNDDKGYMVTVIAVEPTWLLELAPRFYRESESDENCGHK